MLRNWLVVLPLTLVGAMPQKSSDLFVTNKVWTIHLTFTAAQWQAMEPRGGPAPGGPAGMGRPLGRGDVQLPRQEGGEGLHLRVGHVAVGGAHRHVQPGRGDGLEHGAHRAAR